MRVHELAKQLGLTSKDLLARLKERHIEAKNHMTSLDEDVVKLFLEERAAKTGVPLKGKKEDLGRGKARSAAPKKERKAASPAGAEVEVPEAAAAASAETAPAEQDQAAVEAPARPLKVLQVPCPITIKDLAVRLQLRAGDLIKTLMTQFKLFASINQSLGEPIVREVLKIYGFELELPPAQDSVESQAVGRRVDKALLKPRSPIVTFMGHVDHGKTSLLDAIRRTKVVDSEHGGITQHIGAYEVILAKGSITFLDTPGHEAFTAMRARGANVTDIVVLVVAADDGVMPQTIEALDHAKAARVPIIVAMNKIDKPGADLEKLKRQLNELGLVPEDWGGKTIAVGVSAKTGEGIDALLEMILLEAEMLELKASHETEAMGVVIEAKLSKGRGPVASLLVQSGCLKGGDFVVAGHHYGRVKAIHDSFRQPIVAACPSKPVEIIGLSGVPVAGEKFFVISDEKKAREIVAQRHEEQRRQRLEPAGQKAHIHLEDLYREIKQGAVKELNIILKADVQGSLGAIEDSLGKLKDAEVKVAVMHKGVGAINTSDVVLATASDAIIIGFHVDPDPLAREMAAKEGIDIRTYRVIYEIYNDIKAALEGMLAPKIKRVFLGRAEVKKVFNLTKHGMVAGSIVKKGRITRQAHIVLLRNGQIVHEGKVAALKRFKDDVREVQEGFECGISISGFQAIQQGDVIDAFQLEEIARKLDV
ncbi:MAG: translation initiation factor IF-2 [Deltaproteobacteria bacterium]